ncbi:hypothetical protein K1719_002637 [Acacia pycnantha]|nr:hypothetical protein K1719_002637 [Acacia pycnantha]
MSHVYENDHDDKYTVIIVMEVFYGKKCVAKELVESIDKENKKITFKVLEGDLLEHYKSFRITIKAMPKEKGSVVHWNEEYEKLNDHSPDPHSFLQLVINVSKHIDAHLVA